MPALSLLGEALQDDNSVLNPGEAWWRDHQQWLAERGYMLRPRYRPGWKPSWSKTPGKPYWTCEDGISASVRISRLQLRYSLIRSRPQNFVILDAIRTSDKQMVALKRVLTSKFPYEVDISQYLSSNELRTDPRNHCVPIWDVLSVPDSDDDVIIVMPLLRACSDPPWQTLGEVMSFFLQLFEVSWYPPSSSRRIN